jgi:hypothetical protein
MKFRFLGAMASKDILPASITCDTACGASGDSEGAIDAFATTAWLGLQHPFMFMHATAAA